MVRSLQEPTTQKAPCAAAKHCKMPHCSGADCSGWTHCPNSVSYPPPSTLVSFGVRAVVSCLLNAPAPWQPLLSEVSLRACLFTMTISAGRSAVGVHGQLEALYNPVWTYFIHSLPFIGALTWHHQTPTIIS